MDYRRVITYGISPDTPHIGNIIYDIEYINPNWKFIVQTYPESYYVAGFVAVESHFYLFNRKSEEPTVLSGTRDEVIELWKAIFSIKADYIDKFSPAIVDHFIDLDIANFEERYAMYCKYLQPEGYEYIKGINTFYLVKKSIRSRVESALIGYNPNEEFEFDSFL